MQQNKETQQYSNSFFIPEILSLQQQKKRFRCPNNYQASFVCVSSTCQIPGIMCLENNCQCRRTHYKCHHILLDRVLESIEKHQKEIPVKVKETYKTIYEIINQMIQKLSKLRTKFQRQQQYFGLREEQLQFMDLINEQKIEQINGKIVSSLEKTFDIQINLNHITEDIKKDFQSKKQQFDKLCHYIEESYSQNKNEKIKISLNQNFINDSKIVQDSKQRQLLEKWVKQSLDSKKIKSELLFRASQHNFKSSKFHQLCDGKINTFVIVKNEFDKVIGGFTISEWNSLSIDIFDKTYKSFVYSLSLKQKYKHVNKSNRSIYGKPEYGPIFGGSSDLAITDKCHQNAKSFGNLGCSYNLQIDNKNKYENNTSQTINIFTGNSNNFYFKVKQYEVYQIKIEQK